MSLRRKLFLTFACLLVLVAAQGAAAWTIISQLVDSSSQLVAPALARVDLLAHLEADVLRLHALEHVRSENPSVQADPEFSAQQDALRASIERNLQAYSAQALDARRRAMLDTVLQQFADVDAADVDDEVAFDALDAQLHQFRHVEYAVTEAARDTLASQAMWARWPLVLLVVVVAAAEVLLGWYLSRGLIRSVAALRAGARRIGHEDFSTPVARPTEAEFAELAASLNTVMLELSHHHAERARADAERVSLARERLVQIVQAQEEERARLARELHDEAGQSMTALKYRLDHLHHTARDAATRQEVERMLDLAASTMRRLGRLARDLRPGVLDDLGLVPALQSLVREHRERCDSPAVLHVPASMPRLDPGLETTVFRVIQEALTNAARHANARHAFVALDCQDRLLRLEIRDDGEGFDVSHQRRGLGLAGIQERVRLAGGEFDLRSAPGHGTTIRVQLPVILAAHQAEARIP